MKTASGLPLEHQIQARLRDQTVALLPEQGDQVDLPTLARILDDDEAWPASDVYKRQVPSVFYILGLRRPGDTNPATLHQPEFDFNDDAIATGVELMVALAAH